MIWGSLALVCKEKKGKEEEEETTAGLKSCRESLNESERKLREKSISSNWVLVGPIAPNLAMLKTLTCGPRMKTTKKTKMIAEKSSFQKVYIWHSFEISKFESRFGVKRLIYPF